MDNEPLYSQLILTGREYGYCAGPGSPGASVVVAYICPADYVPLTTIEYSGTYYFGVNSYFANAGTKAYPVTSASFNGVMFYNSSVTINQITDGTSNTLLAGERFSFDQLMTDSELADVRGWAWCNYNSGEDVLADTSNPINTTAAVTGTCGTCGRTNVFGSGHDSGANFVFCDGSVHFLNQTIPLATLQRLSVPNDGHTITIDGYE